MWCVVRRRTQLCSSFSGQKTHTNFFATRSVSTTLVVPRSGRTAAVVVSLHLPASSRVQDAIRDESVAVDAAWTFMGSSNYQSKEVLFNKKVHSY